MLPENEIVAVRDREFISIRAGGYSDGQPYIKDVPSVIDALIVRPDDWQALMAALLFIDVSVDRDYPPFDLILPYFPGARQDRINGEGDLLFTARSIAKIINSLPNILTVKILDPHSDVAPALLDRCKVYGANFAWGHEATFFPTLVYDGVIAPDAGALRRANKVAELLDVHEVLQGWKHRDVRTGKIHGFGLQKPSVLSRLGGHYLVVDDICDGGNTFIGLAKEINKLDITADLYVTHGLFSGGTQELKKYYGKIFCSDSITNRSAHGVTVIPTVERML